MKKTETKEEVEETLVTETVADTVEELPVVEEKVSKKEIKLPECPVCLGRGRVDLPGNPPTMSCEDCEGTGVKK